MRYLSPLRYPGGKAKLAPFLARVLQAQHPVPTQYAEPFAGGAGAALRLLVDGAVEHVHLNDLNPGIAAFWRAATTHSDGLAELVAGTTPSIEVWHQQASIYRHGTGSDLELGFATFFLNRTNRSGILGGRPIGGLEQAGAWKLDARWNAAALAARIERVGRLAHRITVTELDARDFLAALPAPAETLVYVDPPYMMQGDRLYLDTFSAHDHSQLAAVLRAGEFPWVLTYDQHPKVDELYADVQRDDFLIPYSAQVKQIGREAIVFSRDLVVPGGPFTRQDALASAEG